MGYVIFGSYENFYHETWKVNNFEELLLECDWLEEHGWKVESIVLFLEAQ